MLFFAYASLHNWFRVSQSHSIGSVIVTFLGITYWYIWGTWLPKRKGYRLQREWVNEEDGVSRYVFHRVPKSMGSHSTWAYAWVVRTVIQLITKTSHLKCRSRTRESNCFTYQLVGSCKLFCTKNGFGVVQILYISLWNLGWLVHQFLLYNIL